MSSLRSTMSYNSKSTFDELQWVIHIRKILEEEFEEEDGKLSVTIFNVPKLLMASDPDSYVPQQVAIGPYHYWRSELYEMQSYKLAATKRFLKSLQSFKLDNLVDQLTKYEQRVRACYHKFLDLNGETMVWMMIVDASFLLELLQIYAMQEGEPKREVLSSMSHLVDYAGRKSAHNAMLKDIVMLENQIPLMVLRKLLEFKLSSKEAADEMLIFMFIGLFKQTSPFKMIEKFPSIKVSESAHLLDFFYDMIVPKLETGNDVTIDVEIQQEEEQDKGEDENSKGESSYVKQPFNEIWRILSKHIKGPMKSLNRVVSRPLKVLVKFPWKIISNLPGGKLLKQPVESLFFSKEKGDEEKQENENSSTDLVNKPPLMDEIAIPSVEQLVLAGVNFLPTNGSISSISFDAKTNTFHLPMIRLDVNTEVFLRNLVAYESSVGSGPLVITRYTELMNGIIDSEKDAKILREKGIILNHLKSDQEVANMWNGMSKSLRLSRVPFLDKTIEDVNKSYNNTMKIKIWKFMKSYVFGSWPVLTFLASMFLLFMTALQAFCSIYTCHRFFDKALDFTSPDTN
ncbi:hypothetical protein MtrunA17_Chr4g0002901 [Medicago truncatula]|uniref:UPF0481 plant-like protein n=2 Tax=Medicago truncatula TaxID=3880 RepID=G7JFR5_MEDTR|nr:UPF0481 plant-like protein [Medicago truncatula]RHN58481.1 hypothetical protein MtrunA17_Chr4g0002901 [Medicago truncatula]